jgi:hypothetical protein
MDSRLNKLANTIVNHSLKLKKGSKVLIRSLSEAKEFRDDNPLNCDSNIYYKDDNGEYQVYDESDTSLTPSTYYCLIKYETNSWSIYDYIPMKDTIIIGDKTYSIIYYQYKYYLVNKDRINDISYDDCIVLNFSDEMPESYVLRANPKYVYLEETEDTSDEYFSSYENINSASDYLTLSDLKYKGYSNFKYKMVPTTEFTIGSFQIIKDETEEEKIFNEVKNLITDQINAYKVFVDGYNLKNNLEVSRKLFFILGKLQHYYSGASRRFPYISFNSFHDKTLEHLGNYIYYSYYSSSSYLKNCNSIITRLGARILCNWNLSYNEKIFVKELPYESLDYDIPLIMYEKDISGNELGYGYYSSLTIIPSEENKDITIKQHISNIEFLDEFTTPKNIYKMTYIPNVPSQYEHLFQKLENE